MTSNPLGQYPAADYVLAHISDTHFLGVDPEGRARALYGLVDTDSPVRAAMHKLQAMGVAIDALVFTGDIADLGEVDAYRRLRGIVQPVADELGAKLLWVMGNHDERAPFQRELYDAEAPDDSPVDRVDYIGDLRVITLDSTVPGFHHGSLDQSQLDWLAEVLSVPAAHGSILALHHPPIPTPLGVMTILELEHQGALAEVVRGSDVRAILGGHLHYASTSTFAGIPVSVAAASCYTMDVGATDRQLVGVDGGQSINLVHVYEHQVVHSVVPLAAAPVVVKYESSFLDSMERLTDVERREAFSRKRS